MDFLERLSRSVSEHKDANAFCIGGKYYTYRDLGKAVLDTAGLLKTHAPHDVRIGIMAVDSFETYAAMIAVMYSGKTYIPIHPDHPAERVAQIVEQSGTKVILSSGAFIEVPEVRCIQTRFTPGTFDGPFQARIAETDDYVYILFTSGSTGRPKGVPLTYANLDAFTAAFFDLGYEIGPNDRFLQMFDLTFDLSIMSYLMPLCVGACVYTVPNHGLKFTHIYGLLESFDITFALMVPSILSSLRPYFDEINLPHLRYSLFCGEALHGEVATEWAACMPNGHIENVYGPTEATIFCMTYRFVGSGSKKYNGIISIGKPMMGTDVLVCDADGVPLETGEKGELCLAGTQVTPGYLDEEKNKEAFISLNGRRFYRTGDLVFRELAGDYLYCGRKDHQVKIQGYRIELGEVEHHVRQVVKDRAVAAVAVPNSKGLMEIHVAIEGREAIPETITTELAAIMPAYMLPSRVWAVPVFPLNANGKTDRKQLEKLALS